MLDPRLSGSPDRTARRRPLSARRGGRALASLVAVAVQAGCGSGGPAPPDLLAFDGEPPEDLRCAGRDLRPVPYLRVVVTNLRTGARICDAEVDQEAGHLYYELAVTPQCVYEGGFAGPSHVEVKRGGFATEEREVLVAVDANCVPITLDLSFALRPLAP